MIAEDFNQTYHIAQDRMALLPNYYSWIYSHIRDYLSGIVVELGSGSGYVMKNYIHQVDKVIAVDYNQQLLDRLKYLYPTDKVVSVWADLKDEWHELDSIVADAVLSFDVLEHFEDEDSFMSNIGKILKKGGWMVLKVPAQSRLFSEMDIASGHYRRYDTEHLADLMHSHGFKVISQRFMNPVGAFIYRFKRKKKTNFSRSVSPTTLKLANRLIPLLALFDNLPGVKGLSLIGIYEKL